MKRLLLLRHAKSSWAEPDRSDFDRPLNGRGKRDAPRAGRRLAEAGVEPDAIVSSPARRARKTARKVARELDFPADRIHYDEAIYEADLATLLAVVRGLDDSWEEVLLVGHNPGFTELAECLARAGIANIPTCAVLAVSLAVDAWDQVEAGAGTVLFYDYPKKHPPAAD